MGGILSHFNGTDESDYEKILSDLDDKIQRAEIRLSEIRIRERRALIIWLVYSILAYALYLFGFFVYLSNPYDEWPQWTFKITPLIVGPILIMLIKSLLNVWYHRKQTNEESELISLRANQRLRVEELKKKTAYYSTKSLLERYDSPNSRSASAPPPRDRHTTQNQNNPQQPPQNPQRGPTPRQQYQPSVPPGMRPPQQKPGAPGMPPLPPGAALQTRPGAPPAGFTQPQSPASAPAQRNWYDKLVDVIVGDEGPETRYALICEKCFAHNGLAVADEIEDVQYVCSKCGHFNPSRRRRRMGGPLGLPASAAQHHSRPNSTPLPINGVNPQPSAGFSAPDGRDGRGRSVTPRPIDADEVRPYVLEANNKNTMRQMSGHEEEGESEDGEGEGESEGVVEVAGDGEAEEKVRKRRGGRVKKTGTK